jgi:hypothetical protein
MVGAVKADVEAAMVAIAAMEVESFMIVEVYMIDCFVLEQD